MNLRPYTPADWPPVCRIHDAARPLELAAGGVDPRALRPMVDVAGADEFFESETLVATDAQGDAIGFVSWNGDKVTWLYVDPAHHRRGIGRTLLTEAIARIGPQAWTNCVGGNQAALWLYRSSGMELVFERPSDVEGYPCTGCRVALPTSRMRDPAARRER